MDPAPPFRKGGKVLAVAYFDISGVCFPVKAVTCEGAYPQTSNTISDKQTRTKMPDASLQPTAKWEKIHDWCSSNNNLAFHLPMNR